MIGLSMLVEREIVSYSYSEKTIQCLSKGSIAIEGILQCVIGRLEANGGFGRRGKIVLLDIIQNVFSVIFASENAILLNRMMVSVLAAPSYLNPFPTKNWYIYLKDHFSSIIILRESTFLNRLLMIYQLVFALFEIIFIICLSIFYVTRTCTLSDKCVKLSKFLNFRDSITSGQSETKDSLSNSSSKKPSYDINVYS